MQQSLIRYRTKPDQAAANEELVRAVYAELKTKKSTKQKLNIDPPQQER